MAENNKPRRGSLRMLDAEKASRARNQDIAERQLAAEEIARGERASATRYRAPQNPTRVTVPSWTHSDEEVGDPSAVAKWQAIVGPLGAQSDQYRSRNRAYARADRNAMDADVRRMTGADEERAYKKGGKVKAAAPVKKMQAGGMVKSNASKRADGCAMKGKTKGRMV